MRQVHDASLSDIEEDKDDHASAFRRAPGKENDARQGLLKSREATSSMLKNRSFKTKASSDTSSEGNATIEKLKEMHLEADHAFSFEGEAGDGGARLSAGSSYKPPSVESATDCSSVIGRHVKTYDISRIEFGHMSQVGGNGDCEMKDAGSDTADKACQADISSTFQVRPSRPGTAASPLQVQQSDSGSSPTTTGANNSAASLRFPSGTSRTSAASIRFRARRNPAETSTGSPPERTSLATDENIGDKLRHKHLGSGFWTQQPFQNGGSELPSPRTSRGAPQLGGVAGGCGIARDMSDFPTPPTPPQEFKWQYSQQQHLDADRCMMEHHGWAAPSSPPSAPMADGHGMSPIRPDGYGAHYDAGGAGSSSGAEYAAQPGYFSRPHHGFNSAAHFSDAHCRRDFSGDSYYENTTSQQYEYSKPSYPGGDFAETQQCYHHGQQHECDPRSHYRPQSEVVTEGQYGFQSQPGGWPKYSGNGFSQQDPNFGDNSGYSAPKEFDFSFVGRGNSGWAANTYVPTHEEINAYMERNFTNPGPQTNAPRTEPQWKIYEDEGDSAARQEQGGDPRADTFHAWHDGKTSVHHVSSSTPGNTVTILSIHEITSDEDLSAEFDGSRVDDDGMFFESLVTPLLGGKSCADLCAFGGVIDHNSDAFSSLTAFQIG